MTIYHADKIISAEDNKYKIVFFDITESNFSIIYENLQTQITKNQTIIPPIVNTVNDGFISSVIYDKIQTLLNKLDSIESSKETFLGQTFNTKADLDAFCESGLSPFPEENKIETQIEVEDIQDFNFNEDKTINIVLRTNDDVLSDRSINIFIEEINYFAKAITNKNGIATIILKNIPAGDYNISFTFTGSNTYKSSTISKTFSVNKVDVKYTLTIQEGDIFINQPVDIQIKINSDELINKESMEIGIKENNYKIIIPIQQLNEIQIDNFIVGDNTFYIKIPETKNTNRLNITKNITVKDIANPIISFEELDAGTKLLYKFKYDISADIQDLTGTVDIYCDDELLITTTVLSDTYTYTPKTSGDKVIKIVFTPTDSKICHEAEKEIPFKIEKLETRFDNVELVYREPTEDYLLTGRLIDEENNTCVDKEIKLYINYALINIDTKTSKNGEFEYILKQNITDDTIIQISFSKKDEFYLGCDYIC